MRKSIFVSSAIAAMVITSPTFAADVPIYEVVSDDAIVGEIISSWDGFFVGLNAGIARQRNRGTFAGGLRPSFDEDGFIGGAQIGYNYQIGHWVLGVEADIMYVNIDNSVTTALGTFRSETDWLSTVRGRLGVASNGYLFYLTGGAAFSEIETSFLGASNSSSVTGWTVGAGLDMAVSNNISLRGEYLYVDLGDKTRTYGATTAGYSSEMHIVRAGVNYNFN